MSTSQKEWWQHSSRHLTLDNSFWMMDGLLVTTMMNITFQPQRVWNRPLEHKLEIIYKIFPHYMSGWSFLMIGSNEWLTCLAGTFRASTHCKARENHTFCPVLSALLCTRRVPPRARAPSRLKERWACEQRMLKTANEIDFGGYGLCIRDGPCNQGLVMKYKI